MTSDLLPTITLVTPSYNQAATLEATIESVLSQKYPKLQYVIMDGGSTDGSVDIIKKYEDRLFHWESKPDGGMYEALNVAFSKTDGEIMGWINSDDVLFPNSLNKLAYLFSRYPDTEWLHGLPTVSNSENTLAHVETRPCRFSAKYYARGWKNVLFAQPQDSTFWRRRLWSTAGARLETRYRLAADLHLWCQFARHCNPLSVKTLLGTFRVTQSNRSITEKKSYDSEAREITGEIRDYLSSSITEIKAGEVAEVDFDFPSFNQYCRQHGLSKTHVQGSAIREVQIASILGFAQFYFISGPSWLGQTLAHEAGDALNKDHDISWFPANLPDFRGHNINPELKREDRFNVLQKSITPDLTKQQLAAVLEAYEAEIGCVRRCHVKSLWYAKLLFVAHRDEEGKSFLFHSLKLNGVYKDALETAALFLGPLSFSKALAGAQKQDPNITVAQSILQNGISTPQVRPSVTARNLLKEARLEEVYGQLLSGQFKVLSVDFFDTLVGRFVAQPKDVFYLLAERLHAEGLLNFNCSISAFAALRQEAEVKARFTLWEKSIPGECRLPEIYEHLAIFLNDVPKAMEMEVELEKSLCFLNPAIASLVDWFIEQGGRVVIASDMYLSSNCLHEILKANNFDPIRFEKTFVSSETRHSKNKGSLFDFIASECGVPSTQIFHIGDHLHSDVTMPQSKGIAAYHYAQSDRTTDAILERENFVHAGRPSVSLNSLRFIGYNLRSQIQPAENQAYQIGVQTIGPALTLYADWVVRSCRQKNLSHVLCLMREGGLLSTMVQRAAAHLQYPLIANRLYVSRSSLRLASLGTPTLLAAVERTSKRGGASLLDLCKIFDLPSKMVAPLNTDLKAPFDATKFVRFICSQPELVSHIQKSSREHRQLALNYINTVLGVSKRVALVDLGFRATIQHFLVQIFRLEQLDVDVHGLYFASGPEISSRLIHGYNIDAFLNGTHPEFAQIRAFTAHPEILEQTVSSTFEGTTLGYESGPDGISRPVLQPITVPAWDLTARRAVQRGVLDFQKLWIKTCLANPRFSKLVGESSSADAQMEAFRIIQRLITMPTTLESEVLGSIVHDENNGFNGGGKICPEYARVAVRNGDLQQLLLRRPYWPNGVIGMEDQSYFNSTIAKLNFIRKN